MQSANNMIHALSLQIKDLNQSEAAAAAEKERFRKMCENTQNLHVSLEKAKNTIQTLKDETVRQHNNKWLVAMSNKRDNRAALGRAWMEWLYAIAVQRHENESETHALQLQKLEKETKLLWEETKLKDKQRQEQLRADCWVRLTCGMLDADMECQLKMEALEIRKHLRSERWLRFTIGLMQINTEQNQYALPKHDFLEQMDFGNFLNKTVKRLCFRPPDEPPSLQLLAGAIVPAMEEVEMGEGVWEYEDEADEEEEPPKMFPEGLGPFALHDTQRFGEDIIIDSDQIDISRTWSIDCDADIWSSSEHLQRLHSCVRQWPVRGNVGPMQLLQTLPFAELENMKAPESTKSFTWSVAIPNDFNPGTELEVADIANSGSPEVAFILRGGFLYCDKNGKICGISTIAPASQHSGMQFGTPLRWKLEWTAAIQKRFSRITIQALKDKGACHYCWIRPEERELFHHDDAPSLKYGGFVYLFHEDIVPPIEDQDQQLDAFKDCVFPLEQILETTADSQGQTFNFVSDLWAKYADVMQTPYSFLTSTMEDMRSKEMITDSQFQQIMKSIEDISTGKGGQVRHLHEEDDQDGADNELSPWLESVGCRERKLALTITQVGSEPLEAPDDDQQLEPRVASNQWTQEEQDLMFAAEKLYEMETDCMATDPEHVLYLVDRVFDSYPIDLTTLYNLDRDSLKRWLEAIKFQYNNNSYHNWNHAWDAFQFIVVALHQWDTNADDKNSQNALSPFNRLVLYTSAIALDVGHQGLTNQYLTRMSDPLAITYNDQSILENMHCSVIFQTLQHNGYSEEACQDFLKDMQFDQYSAFREKVVRVMLATDMSQHFSIVDKLYVATNKGRPAAAKRKSISENEPSAELDGDLVTCAMLKLADMSNPLRPFETYLKATELLEEEFFLQGDLERIKGIPISAMMDRNRDSLCDAQQGFINFIAGPFVQCMQSILAVPLALRLQRDLQQNQSRMCEYAMCGVVSSVGNEDVAHIVTARSISSRSAGRTTDVPESERNQHSDSTGSRQSAKSKKKPTKKMEKLDPMTDSMKASDGATKSPRSASKQKK